MKIRIMDILFTDNELLPAIIQDDKSLKVLMLGYMNRESYEKTLETGLVTFFSRSRKKLWTKGETSGNYLHLVSLEKDCDSDTFLVRVNPEGPVCHTGNVSCFGGLDHEGFINRLASVIAKRREEMPENSYTTKLFKEGIVKISKKVGEEASETIIEAVRGDNERLVYEISDLVYHTLVLMEYRGISVEDIEKELFTRHS
jgi:phosphoribosyl-ATP pyrophosphohydrolase/phosphoribosyl-AMP cyclohydrolase